MDGKPDLDSLLIFAKVVEAQSFSEAARRLKMPISTVSRRIDKLTGRLRKKILAGLIHKGMSRRQAEEALEADVRDLQINIRRRLE